MSTSLSSRKNLNKKASSPIKALFLALFLIYFRSMDIFSNKSEQVIFSFAPIFFTTQILLFAYLSSAVSEDILFGLSPNSISSLVAVS